MLAPISPSSGSDAALLVPRPTVDVRAWRLGPPLVFGLAVLTRFGMVLASAGGPTGNYGYDAGVYYSSADALIHGRVPYRDFLLLHPPGLMLALTLFAVIGRLTSDHAGFVVGNSAFVLLGAGSAVLVYAVALRQGLSRGAALSGGIFYATWFGVASTEISSRLEPLGSNLFVAALWFLTGDRAGSRRRVLMAGLALGGAASVKIWWIVPLVVVLGWQVVSAERRANAGRFAAGALGGIVLVCGPFFVLAPRAMWRMVVSDQLGRHMITPLATRLAELTAVSGALPTRDHAATMALCVLVGAIAVMIGTAAWRQSPATRPIIVVAVAQVVVLLTAPSYFSYYSGYPAVAFALIVAGAAGAGDGAGDAALLARAGTAGARIVTAVAVGCTAAATLTGRGATITPFPGPQLASRVVHVRCIMADSPMALIELDALSRGLADGCPNWIDVSGRTYDVDSPVGPNPRRTANMKWQHDARSYLESGDALILIRRQSGLTGLTKELLSRGAVLARSHGYVIRRSTHS